MCECIYVYVLEGEEELRSSQGERKDGRGGEGERGRQSNTQTGKGVGNASTILLYF